MTRALITDEARTAGASMGPVQLGYVCTRTASEMGKTHAQAWAAVPSAGKYSLGE